MFFKLLKQMPELLTVYEVVTTTTYQLKPEEVDAIRLAMDRGSLTEFLDEFLSSAIYGILVPKWRTLFDKSVGLMPESLIEQLAIVEAMDDTVSYMKWESIINDAIRECTISDDNVLRIVAAQDVLLIPDNPVDKKALTGIEEVIQSFSNLNWVGIYTRRGNVIKHKIFLSRDIF